MLLSRKATTQSTLQSISLCSRPVKYCLMVADRQSRACRLFPRPTPLVTYNHGMDNFETSTLYFKHNNGNKIIKICAYIKSSVKTRLTYFKIQISEPFTQDNYFFNAFVCVVIVMLRNKQLDNFRIEFLHLFNLDSRALKHQL